jgi:hypothetical protein
MGARREQCPHHRAPKGAGTAGYHHVSISKIHRTLMFVGLAAVPTGLPD